VNVTIAQVTTGVTGTITFTAKSAWNKAAASWLVPENWNWYQIEYLNYAYILFSVFNPNTGNFEAVHQINFPNAGTSIMLNTASFRAGVFAASLGSSGSNLIAYGTEIYAGICGPDDKVRNPRATSNTKSVTTTLTNLFTLRCVEVFGEYPNQGEAEPLVITGFTEGTKGALIGLYSNATVGGVPNFNYLSQSNSIIEIDTAGTTVTGGTPLYESRVTSTGQLQNTFLNSGFRIPPTLTLTVAAKVISGSSADTGASLNWYEDVQE
jgi:hypothetical protein